MVSLLGGATRSLGNEFDTRLAAIETTLAERGQALIREWMADKASDLPPSEML